MQNLCDDTSAVCDRPLISTSCWVELCTWAEERAAELLERANRDGYDVTSVKVSIGRYNHEV